MSKMENMMVSMGELMIYVVKYNFVVYFYRFAGRYGHT